MSKGIDVLIVEYRPVMRAMLREFLRSGFPGRDIEEAVDVRRALELVRERRPALVLIDFDLPDVHGIELTAQIRVLFPDTRLIVLSQHTGEVYKERAHSVGAFAFVAKEKIYTELLPLVARALHEEPPLRDPGPSE